MAVVLSSEDSGFFNSSSLKRSHSQSQFSKQPSGLHSSASTTRLNTAAYHDSYQSYHISPPSSSPSSATSSPQTIHADLVTPSDLSTPATTISLDDDHWHEDGLHLDDRHDIILHEYDVNPFFSSVEDLEPPTSPHTGDSYSVSPAEHDTPTTTSRPGSPTLLEHAEDDTAVRHHPTHHVDYLSHDWKEEDIWSSWRYIISRRNDFTNSSRLENASWRTWMKSKYRLKTVSPETLNWLKDCDVTWLYGPLQTRNKKLFPNDTLQGSSTLSRNDSFIQKKPILKKRSMSEVMLQKSISSSSLLKQAAAAVQAQQQDIGVRIARPILSRATTDFDTFPFSSRRASLGDTGLAPSTDTSGLISPSAERKHIHFDEQVQQCIAVDVKGEEEEDEEVEEHDYWNHDDDSDSDDGVFIMAKNPKKRLARPRPKLRTNSSIDSKTIAMLPSTTLKYREDTPEPRETAMKHSTGSVRSPPFNSPSSSQETLRPSKQSGRFFVEDEEMMADEETNTTPMSSPIETLSQSSLQRSTSSGNLLTEPAGMRRTESGMFMPYEEGDGQENAGIIGRVVDTVNTARDIAHVIWNVGWRR